MNYPMTPHQYTQGEYDNLMRRWLVNSYQVVSGYKPQQIDSETEDVAPDQWSVTPNTSFQLLSYILQSTNDKNFWNLNSSYILLSAMLVGFEEDIVGLYTLRNDNRLLVLCEIFLQFAMCMISEGTINQLEQLIHSFDDDIIKHQYNFETPLFSLLRIAQLPIQDATFASREDVSNSYYMRRLFDNYMRLTKPQNTIASWHKMQRLAYRIVYLSNKELLQYVRYFMMQIATIRHNRMWR